MTEMNAVASTYVLASVLRVPTPARKAERKPKPRLAPVVDDESGRPARYL